MQYTKRQLRGAYFMVPLGGCDLQVTQKEDIDPETGEVLSDALHWYVIGLEAGMHRGQDIAETAPRNARFEPVGENAKAVRLVGNARMEEITRMTPMQVPHKYRTGANEDFKPRDIEDQKAEALIKRLKQENDRAEKIAKEQRDRKAAAKAEALRLQQEAAAEAAAEEAEEAKRQAALGAEQAAANAAEE